MHKNHFNPKTLCGNWYEERATEDFEKFNSTTNTYLKNPCKYFSLMNFSI